jgi:hypothetical protein
MDNSYTDPFACSTFDDFLLEEGLHEEVESQRSSECSPGKLKTHHYRNRGMVVVFPAERKLPCPTPPTLQKRYN